MNLLCASLVTKPTFENTPCHKSSLRLISRSLCHISIRLLHIPVWIYGLGFFSCVTEKSWVLKTTFLRKVNFDSSFSCISAERHNLVVLHTLKNTHTQVDINVIIQFPCTKSGVNDGNRGSKHHSVLSHTQAGVEYQAVPSKNSPSVSFITQKPKTLQQLLTQRLSLCSNQETVY